MVDGYEATALGAPKGIIVPIEIDGPYRERGTCYLNAIASVNGVPFQPTAAQLERLEVVRKAGF